MEAVAVHWLYCVKVIKWYTYAHDLILFCFVDNTELKVKLGQFWKTKQRKIKIRYKLPKRQGSCLSITEMNIHGFANHSD